MGRRATSGPATSGPAILFLVVGLFLSACGGGGGGGPTAGTLPEVWNVTPALVSSGVATRVTATGTGLSGAVSVRLSDVSSGGAVVLIDPVAASDATAEATVPATAPLGTYDVQVTTPAGTNATSLVKVRVAAAPVVTGLAPARGFDDRATAVAIAGSGFAGASKVSLDDPAATALSSVAVTGEGGITAIVPPGVAPGSWNVRVTTPAGTNAASGVRFEARNLIDPDRVGTFLAGFVDATIAGATGDAPAARLWYPALANGAGTTPDPALAPYPAVVLNHAYKPPLVAGSIDYKAYGWLAERLASFGYVVISVDQTPNNGLDSIASQIGRDAADARAALATLAARSATPGDLLSGLVDPNAAAVGGHSRGGAASLRAAADEVAASGAAARFRAVFTLGAPSFDPLSGSRIPLGTFSAVPALHVGATNDQITPFADQQDLYLQSGSPSLLLEVVGGNHALYTDSGQAFPFDGTATIPLATQHDVCRRYVVAWLGARVKGQGAFFAPYLGGGAAFLSDPRTQQRSWK